MDIITDMLHSVNSNKCISGGELQRVKKGQKIWRDGVEMKPGQIGRLTVARDTYLYKPEGKFKVTARVLKAGEKYRIYALKPGMLSEGGGLFVDRDYIAGGELQT